MDVSCLAGCAALLEEAEEAFGTGRAALLEEVLAMWAGCAALLEEAFLNTKNRSMMLSWSFLLRTSSNPKWLRR